MRRAYHPSGPIADVDSLEPEREQGGLRAGALEPVSCTTCRGPAAFAFVAVVPVAVVLVAIGAFVAPHVVQPVGPGRTMLQFFSGVEVAPEPLEQVRYLLFLLSAPAVITTSILLARITRGIHLSKGLLVGFSVLVELLVSAGILLWWSEQQENYEYFSSAVLLTALAAAAAAVSALFWLPARPLPWHRWSERRMAAVSAASAMAVTVIALLPGLFHETNIASSHPVVHFHLQFTMDEFLAVANDRTPLVDFVPQYSNLLPYLLTPVIAVVGYSVGTFTASMFLFSMATMLSVFYVFARVSGRWVVGLLLYLPFVGLSLYRTMSDGREHVFVANYFAVVPLRYLGPWVVAGLLVWGLRRPSRRRLVVLFFGAGLVMLNNPDFGIPSFVASLLAAWLGRGGAAMRSAGSTLHLLATAATGLASAVMAVVIMSVVRTGHLPDFGASLYFARQFALSGFYMLPMPSTGLHLVIGITLAGALVRAFFRGAGRLEQTEQGRLLTASMTYGSVFGLGASSYYVGRSHPHVLVAVFSAWAFVLALLICDAWLGVRRAPGPRSTERVLWFAPSVLVAGHLFLSVVPAWEMRDVAQQVDRISTAGRPTILRNDELAAYVRRHSSPGETVLILAPLSHRAALAAGVQDAFPYNSVESVVTQEQLDVVRDRLRAEGVLKVFTAVPLRREIGDALLEDGFRPSTVADQVGAPVLWQRPTVGPAHSARNGAKGIW